MLASLLLDMKEISHFKSDIFCLPGTNVNHFRSQEFNIAVDDSWGFYLKICRDADVSVCVCGGRN